MFGTKSLNSGIINFMYMQGESVAEYCCQHIELYSNVTKAIERLNPKSLTHIPIGHNALFWVPYLYYLT